MTARALRVAVIGGGIGGLAAARALLLRGMEVTVYEQAPRLSEFGGGVVLTPNALTALRALDAASAFCTEWPRMASARENASSAA